MVFVVGAGFAGVEAAWAIASRRERVTLYEMRPNQTTPAHVTDYFAELVCSNSLKSKLPTSPAGQLKWEMDALGSVVLEVARQCEVPAGEALGVDRELFGREITRKIEAHELIEVRREPVFPEMIERWLSERAHVILATGPLTTPEVSQWLAELTGRTHLYFYDAVSPTVEASSVDRGVAFPQSRYDRGEGDDYLNCPFERNSYELFVRELVAAERAPIHAFEAGGRRDLEQGAEREEAFLEKVQYFAGCMPIEAIAERGERSLAFGNFKPVGLTDPRTGRRPYAAIQLRPENKEKTLYSLVACQTRLKWGEQRRVFRMVPGLEHAEFVRYGVIHRNTYLEAPKVLDSRLQVHAWPNLFVAGQLTGVEGYVESAAMGIYAGLAALDLVTQPPRECAYGALLAHLQDETPREFAPMNINWGLFPEPPGFEAGKKVDKDMKRSLRLSRAREAFERWIQDAGLDRAIDLTQRSECS